ncbi:flagellar motor protein MotB [Desulfoscipio geothermicus]|uniref:Chemotaxis protein MotB n=1 Tax=Desulfoscipio geothermicus DSM 3669 TaxID=1121426 RepID=A0A1I6CU91_9FIRM|nr:flagellar motor protein MotB [Desulfoscipio geothermicus]SFQ96805.1 chemotaxis protein MotB [Desulfoscipio geothermicus DSM 3669]
MVNRRRHKKESEGNKERWLITYADMITLLLIFFIVMYTLSKIDAAKFETLAESLAAVFGAGGMVLDSPGPQVITGTPPEQVQDIVEKAQLDNLKKKLENYIQENGLATRVSVTTEERGIVLSFQDNVLFELGSARLTPRAREILDKVAPILADTPNYIRVEGHTDNLPINNARFPSNWELSAARATNVVQELIREHGFAPQKLSATAYGEYRPRVPNTSPENRQLNRRVDLVILRSKFAEIEPETLPILTTRNNSIKEE